MINSGSLTLERPAGYPRHGGRGLPGVRAPSVVEHAAPTKVIVSFDLLPGWQEAWSDLWTRIGRLALTRPACSEFRLLRDWRDGKRCFVVSTWTDAQAFDQFAREVGLAWMAREMRQVASPTGITYQISQRSNADSDLDSLPLDEAPLDE